jgi:uncharacterized protein
VALREELQHQRDALHQIAARYGVSSLRLFGSVARGEERPDSDIDLLIDLVDDRGFGDYLALAEELEFVLHRKVDLVLARSLSPDFRPISRPTQGRCEIRSALLGAYLSKAQRALRSRVFGPPQLASSAPSAPPRRILLLHPSTGSNLTPRSIVSPHTARDDIDRPPYPISSCHVRPSRSISAIAAVGPQLPAG